MERLIRAGRSCIRIGHDRRNELPDFLDVLLAACGHEVAGDGLGCEQGGPGHLDFGLGAGPFAAVEGLDGELDDELIG